MSKLGFNLIYNLEIRNNIEREREKYHRIQCSNYTFNLSTKFTTKFEFKIWNLKLKRNNNRKEKE
jgi:hypothetical protein